MSAIDLTDFGERPRVWPRLLATACAIESLLLALAFRFETVVPWLQELPFGAAIQSLLTANITAWTGDSYDTTLGYRQFGMRASWFALAFFVAAIGLWSRQRWAYTLSMLLWSIALLAAPLRLLAIRQLVPYSDSLGYQLDVQLAQMALGVATIPAAVVLTILLFPVTRTEFRLRQHHWGQISLAGIAAATTVTAVLTSQVQLLWQVYGWS